MSDTLLSDLPKTVSTMVKSFMPDLAECKPHAGKFSLEELKRKGLPSPSVLVSVLGAKQDTTYAGHANTFMLQMAVYVVVRDGLGAPRDVRAANICQKILSFVPGQNWDNPAMGEARNVRMHTLVSSKAKDHAVSLWAVTWDQPISFFQPEARPLGVELYVAQVSGDEPEVEEDYTQIGGQG
ncbi:hypothetical protein GTA62_13055 [Roseobacter sp. HKCCD9010]|uniref:hypothetical protein n=1 Tax=unclassified Roseobacter TaxID=196798 RepID=UPI001490C82E|nr:MULTISPECIES: hypothetical protein [unclassified Roseobacter]MBF9049888.1 hypothetical protein [Rhodobacterales bacterium HKCCD4356]NNV13573.1 hypothetical protein [Roseobacter sp. HKCCD7357]NNV16407.1 hypothetical protein [Roseobacter sp. HKCCD8768]NNV25866.1 hypothetical protein [Roseobacter sp. HKCCD8192]NNV30124.1 hypothetical protein [Roseobacter sp. HKCCD9061]